METAGGIRFLVVEQKGKDLWRGRFKTVEEAIENQAAGIGVDRILLTRCAQHNVTTVMVVIEEQRRIFLSPVSDLLDPETSRGRSNYNGRALRIIDYQKWTMRYLGPAKTKAHRRS